MEIREVPVEKLNPAAYNPRKDLKPGDPEYEKLKRSLDTFGCVEPIVWNERTGNVVGGHQRLKVLKNQNGGGRYTGLSRQSLGRRGEGAERGA